MSLLLEAKVEGNTKARQVWYNKKLFNNGYRVTIDPSGLVHAGRMDTEWGVSGKSDSGQCLANGVNAFLNPEVSPGVFEHNYTVYRELTFHCVCREWGTKLRCQKIGHGNTFLVL